MQGVLISGIDYQSDGSPARLPCEDGAFCDSGLRSGTFVKTVWPEGAWAAGVWSEVVWGHGRVW